MKVLYVVHDLHDSAVARRVRMLTAAGAQVTVAGFRRLDEVPASVAGAQAIDLGRTRDARLGQRALAVLRNLLAPKPLVEAALGCDVIIGRNLEALPLALRARAASPAAKLVYECLDIHRMLLGKSAAATTIQAIESRMLRHVDLVLTSSPAFEREYFARRPSLRAPVMLLENKVLALEGDAGAVPDPGAGPPWVIAWFGMLRCERTFSILEDMVRRHAGRIEVHIAGRPSPAVFPDFHARVARVPQFRYLGAYTAADLPALYAPCHFAWAIDYFEEGQNSRWLLPNRLYEAASFGVVPIALQEVETGRWLEEQGAGLRIADDPGALDQALALKPIEYTRMRAAVRSIPREALIATRHDCDALYQRLATL